MGMFGVRPRLARLSGRLAYQAVGPPVPAFPNPSCFSSFAICRGCCKYYSVVVAEPGSPPPLNLSAFGGPALLLTGSMRPVHPSAWKAHSANFACTSLYEILGSS